MSSIYGKIGESKPDYLLSDPKDGDKIAVPMYPGNGVVKRGTLLFRESNGMYSPAAAADAVDNNSLVVLDETVDTDVSETIAENAAAYRAGHFVDGRVTLKNDGELTDAIKLTLRKQGIVFDVDENAAVFNNELAAEGGETQQGGGTTGGGTQQGGDNAGGDNAGGDTTGGETTGGDNAGGETTGGDNAGGTNP